MTARIFVMVFTDNARLERLTFSLLQSAGCCPMLPAADESPADALHRVRPDAVMIDCEHPAAVNDRFFETAEQVGVGVLVYGRDTREVDAELIARQQNVCRITLPAEGDLIAHALLGAMPSVTPVEMRPGL